MKINHRVRSPLLAAATLLCAAAGAAAPGAAAQGGPLALNAAAARSAATDRAMELSTSLRRGGYAVVIDLDVNELSFRKGASVLWTAPIGTGTGLRLDAGDQEWDFSTPNGVFHVQYKEQNPVWIAPDWYFIENDLPVPPRDHESRYFPGGLGAAAVYIGHELAIHGTDKPELLGLRVSHGCIRLSDKDAKRLYHNVQIGTEVVIVGGERLEEERQDELEAGNDPSTFDPTKVVAKPKPRDPMLERWQRMATPALAEALADELWMPEESSRWPELASLLLDRGLTDADDEALAAVLMGVADLPNDRVEREYRTFLADAFARGTLRSLLVLSDLDRTHRERAAEAIVAAAVELYGGEMEGPAVPWPTSRVPREVVARGGQLGWNALARAEREYRQESGRGSI